MNPEDNAALHNFASFLSSLSPSEFVSLAFVIGLMLAQPLTKQENNAIGNWFMELAQVMVTTSSQQNYLDSVINPNP